MWSRALSAGRCVSPSQCLSARNSKTLRVALVLMHFAFRSPAIASFARDNRTFRRRSVSSHSHARCHQSPHLAQFRGYRVERPRSHEAQRTLKTKGDTPRFRSRTDPCFASLAVYHDGRRVHQQHSTELNITKKNPAREFHLQNGTGRRKRARRRTLSATPIAELRLHLVRA